MLTANQEDYLEVIYNLDSDGDGARTSDIADRLGCRLPTVTRAVKRMVKLGLVRHESRGLVSLTSRGHLTAENIAHRHADTVQFLTQILGLSREQAEQDACKIEHGVSPLAAQRLHEFLEHINELDEYQRNAITKFAHSTTTMDFPHLRTSRTAGWRG